MKFESQIIKHFCTLSENGSYTYELNLVSFNSMPPKLDLRKWHGGAPLRGVTLTNDEAAALRDALCKIDLHERGETGGGE